MNKNIVTNNKELCQLLPNPLSTLCPGRINNRFFRLRHPCYRVGIAVPNPLPQILRLLYQLRLSQVTSHVNTGKL